MAIEVMNHQLSRLEAVFLEQFRNAIAALKAIIVKYDHSADRKPGPHELKHFFGGLIHIHIDVDKAEGFIAYGLPMNVRENSGENDGVVDFQS